jgi:hypothetical protein
MNNTNRFIFLYIPCFILSGYLLYRMENYTLYQGGAIDALPDGSYTIQSISCLEGKVKFDYTKKLPDTWEKFPDDVRELLYYDGKIDRKVVIKGKQLTRIIGNKDCYIYSREKIKENSDGKFTVAGSKKVDVIPADCKLKYINQGKTYYDEGIKSTGDIALDTEDLITHLVYYKDNQYLLYETYSADFSNYGCSKSDRLITTLVRDI